MEKYYIGIDLGTSAVKLLLVEKNGSIVREVLKEYPCDYPHPGWSEQDPEVWIKETFEGVRQLIEGLDPQMVRGIGTAGQMHGLVALDENDAVIRPAILWNDGRTGKETAYLNEVIGKNVLSDCTGNIAFAGFTAPKILWMRDNEPELFARIRKVMLPKDYLNYKLTGVFSTDVSDASGTLFFDVANKCWSEKMLQICSLREEQLPQVYESAAVTGTLTPDAADALGLSKDTFVIAGAGDNAASAIGTGTITEGTCNISLGTSGTIFLPGDTFRVDQNNSLHSFAHANGKFHLLGCMLSCASCNKWLLEEVFGTQDYDRELDIPLEQLGKNHVYFLPYLMGERSPINDENARAAFIGMTMDTSRKDLVQAVLEGVAFAFRDSLEAAKAMGLTVLRSNLSGRGGRNPVWRKILAAVLNIRLDILQTEQGPGLGAAMLAMVADGTYGSVEEACESIVQIKETIDPDPELAVLYQKRYKEFQQLYPALKDVFRRMSEAE
ncbi:MAG: xylulokinase [Lachnospiraceae bacterium]|nr:xylulokinase [Lachnospiraceae bacterium]MBR6357002.1 xylulokinase [Lachnospiraceae bacterium]